MKLSTAGSYLMLIKKHIYYHVFLFLELYFHIVGSLSDCLISFCELKYMLSASSRNFYHPPHLELGDGQGGGRGPVTMSQSLSVCH